MAGDTFFAPAGRADAATLAHDVDVVARSALVDGLMKSACGLIAVLNEQRQVLAINEVFLRSLGLADAKDILGLRPGEVLHCRYHDRGPDGCGTGPYCSTCGAAIAIVGAIEGDRPVERRCALSVQRDGTTVDLCFIVRATPFEMGDVRLILVFLQDVTLAERWAAMERVFFHDVNNLLAGLRGSVELIPAEEPAARDELVHAALRLCDRVRDEVAVQQMLLRDTAPVATPAVHEVNPPELVEELRALMARHPAAEGKLLLVDDAAPVRRIWSNAALIVRIVANMLTNAFEATSVGGAVRLRVAEAGGAVVFSVWNPLRIPPAIQLRIFQRHFSTKEGRGRGLGTFSMKLLGETVLKGRVDFTSNEVEGTTFNLRLPVGQRG